jgi:hypothetical protein
MLQSADNSEKKVVGNAMLSQDRRITAGRQNLLSAIWGGRNTKVVNAMPNGDPPSFMLWGVEDEMPDKRYNWHEGKV